MNKYSNQRYKVYTRCAGHCGYCGKELNADTLITAKIDPRGVKIFRNLMPCCEECHRDKGLLNLDMFRLKKVWPSLTDEDKQGFRNICRKVREYKFYFETVHQYMPKGRDIEPWES
jgi:5-methylcytosine-specific restriction endonuclease McrA